MDRLAELRRVLGEEAFGAAWQDGRETGDTVVERMA